MSSRLSAKAAYLADPATYPIIGAIGFAVAMCAGCSGRYLFKSPDVKWNKTDRSSTIRQARQSDIGWFSHKQGFARGKSNAINANPEVMNAVDRWRKQGGALHNGFKE